MSDQPKPARHSAPSGETRWFLRSRGTVPRAFTLAQLETQRKRNQLARFDEVSIDRKTWEKASSLPGLFAAPVKRAPVDDSGAREGAIALDGEGAVGALSASASHRQEWLYLKGDKQVGPVSTEDVKQLIVRRELDPTDYVWREGMPAWVTLREVPAFGPSFTNPVAAPGNLATVTINSGPMPGGGPIPVAAPPTSGLAIASLVLGILWVCGIGSVLATIFGAIALHQINKAKGALGGKGMAIAGLALGIVGLIPDLFYLLVFLRVLSIPFLGG